MRASIMIELAGTHVEIQSVQNVLVSVSGQRAPLLFFPFPRSFVASLRDRAAKQEKREQENFQRASSK